MKFNKRLVIPVVLAGVVFSSVAATSLPKKEPLYSNLKVLPKDISSKQLQEIMADDFEDGLGVTCGFCHANAKDGHGLDFVSDEKPEKEIARGMMRMTLGINKKYFKAKHPEIGSNSLTITCNTCHKGEAFPDGDITQK